MTLPGISFYFALPARQAVRAAASSLMLLVASSATQAQPADLAAVRPLIDLVRQDEWELGWAIAEGDAARVKRLQWRNTRASFDIARNDPPVTPGDPAAQHLRQAYLACAEAHSLIGMIAFPASDALLTQRGGESTELLNIMARERMNFFLKPYRQKRQQCDDLTKAGLPATPIAIEAQDMLPGFEGGGVKRLSADDTAALKRAARSLDGVEQTIIAALASDTPDSLHAAIEPLFSFRRLVEERRDAAGPARARHSFKECDWAGIHASQILNEVRQALTRGNIRASTLDEAGKTLAQYQTTKAACFDALEEPRAAAALRLTKDHLQRAKQP